MRATQALEYFKGNVSDRALLSHYSPELNRVDTKKARSVYRKTKYARQKWWNSLTSEEQEEYIQRRQARKAEKRRKHPAKGKIRSMVTSENKAEWEKKIAKKNPWLKKTS